MKKSIFGLALLLSQVVHAQDPVATKYADLITSADLKENLSIIASDALEGRYTGSRGEKMAAAFIASYFENLGLAAPVNGSHYMSIDLYSPRLASAYVKFGPTRFENYSDIVYAGQSDSGGEISLEAVYAGKGTEADYAYIDVKDKAAVILADALDRAAMMKLRDATKMARDKGARIVFVVSGGKPEDFKAFADRMKGFSAGGGLSLNKPDANNPNKGTFYMEASAASKIFNMPFEKIAKATADDAAKKPLSKIKPSRIVYSVAIENKIVKSENMLGFLEGTDKKDEVIVVSAHFDHIGIGRGEGDVINNGADDDGSGTVSVLQLAKAFMQAKKDGRGPRRSILFMTVTGEEEGLFGSQYYVEHPVYPLANTVADLNIDMVGRKDPQHKDKPDYVYVIGADKLSSELNEINERNNKTYTQLDFDYTYNDEKHPDRLYYRSDHWNFAKNNVPIIFYFDGIHEDYHRPSDEVSKIDFDIMVKRDKAVFYTAWELANRENRIAVDKK
ncbi:hypothetical protein WSM22_21100 [Cytophagales bacterium WSM2-2]|nr:hypothetical protein WSM22_21100 [Cytophagales bacterium WSM2-2]